MRRGLRRDVRVQPDLGLVESRVRDGEVRAPDGARLAGHWYPAPGSDATGRTVLLLHGFAEDSTVWEASRATMLNRHGWNVAAPEGEQVPGFGIVDQHAQSLRWMSGIQRQISRSAGQNA